jgi:hypothetical protein
MPTSPTTPSAWSIRSGDSETSSTDSNGNTTDYTTVDVTASFDLNSFAPVFTSSTPNTIGGFQVPGTTVNVTGTFPSGPQSQLRLACAANYGQNHSIAAAFGAQNTFVGNLFGGNTVSNLVNLGQSVFGNGTPTSGDIASTILSGGGQGLPGGGPGFKGVAGQASDAIVGGAVSAGYGAIAGVGQETIELGITAAGTVATPVAQLSAQTLTNVAIGVGLAKLAFDLTTFAIGFAKCE